MRISGKVRRVVHHNDVKDFYILSMILDNNDSIDDHLKGKTVTVKGNITGFDVTNNTWLSMEVLGKHTQSMAISFRYISVLRLVMISLWMR